MKSPDPNPAAREREIAATLGTATTGSTCLCTISFDSDQSTGPVARRCSRVMKARMLLWLTGVGAASVLAAPAQAPKLSGSAVPTGTSLEAGRLVYDQHCAACHGVNGDGNGPASVWLFPKPRNFNSGLFKIQSTPPGSPPTDEDLFQTVTRGMPGSSMPSFTYLSEQDRKEVVQYVKQLT